MTPDERADKLAQIAAQLSARVREDPPPLVHAWLAAEMEGEDWAALAVVQASANPVDQPWLSLTAWAWKPLEDTPQVIAERRRVLVESCAGGDPRHRGRRAQGPAQVVDDVGMVA